MLRICKWPPAMHLRCQVCTVRILRDNVTIRRTPSLSTTTRGSMTHDPSGIPPARGVPRREMCLSFAGVAWMATIGQSTCAGVCTSLPVERQISLEHGVHCSAALCALQAHSPLCALTDPVRNSPLATAIECMNRRPNGLPATEPQRPPRCLQRTQSPLVPSRRHCVADGEGCDSRSAPTAAARLDAVPRERSRSTSWSILSWITSRSGLVGA
jgi:hypothetical protein